MAFDEDLAERVRGGLAFMLNGNMFVGVMKNDLMVRVGPETHDAALEQAGPDPWTSPSVR